MENNLNKAAVPNPALEQLGGFIGEWKTEGSHNMLPGIILKGHTKITWIEGGAFIGIYSEIVNDKIPAGISIIGSDNSMGEYFILYFDERKVSRKLDVKIENNVLTWWRDAPEFSQRYSLTLSEDKNKIAGKGEICKDGKTWEKDLDLNYTRIM